MSLPILALLAAAVQSAAPTTLPSTPRLGTEAARCRPHETGPAILVTGSDGEDPRELDLPGDGFVSNLQSADRGETIGFDTTTATVEKMVFKLPRQLTE